MTEHCDRCGDELQWSGWIRNGHYEFQTAYCTCRGWGRFRVDVPNPGSDTSTPFLLTDGDTQIAVGYREASDEL